MTDGFRTDACNCMQTEKKNSLRNEFQKDKPKETLFASAVEKEPVRKVIDDETDAILRGDNYYGSYSSSIPVCRET